MSCAESHGVLRSRFDQRSDDDPPPQNQLRDATGSTQKRAGDAGPIQIVASRAVATPPASISIATQLDDLDAARGILVGVVLGSISWGLTAGLLYLLLA